MFLFFDTETTGLPSNWKAPITEVDNWPRLVQLAWLVTDAKGDELDRHNYIIRPQGFRIPQAAASIHGISTQQAMEEGIAIEEALQSFADAIDAAAYLVGHNISFDEKIVGAEFIRAEMPHLMFERPRLCTMKSAIDFCAIPGKYGRSKNPSLTQLHQILFAEGFANAHDAMADVDACARCFFALVEEDEIQLT
ncbi:MAG: 3'-5' exonuclease [Bacteroidota bacterium]